MLPPSPPSPPELSFGSKSIKFLNKVSDSLIRYSISALGCNPNNAGDSDVTTSVIYLSHYN
ncbi:MAG: hypothetical protein MJ252_00060 [archaeon]|nr:hypothetical protein [archaeon]